LYADDDPDDQLLFAELLSRLLVAVTALLFDNGLHLLQHLDSMSNADKPAVVILDINMPVMDEITTLQNIRHDARFSNTPVVMYTTSSSPADRQRCIELGANAFYSKPVRREDIASIVKKLTHYL
jgi:CheY-like chemotaxis protein